MDDRPEPIDPTKNVLDLVRAESKYQDAMRQAETKRIEDLAALRSQYEAQISGILREEVKSTSLLLSTQLDRLTNVLNERISPLERFRYEVGGKSTGQSQVVAWAVAGITILIAAASTAVTFLVRQH